jgi:glycolate oxidase iron-sulfur subunit
MCGLCSPHCPTYLLSQDENESPRGRIALMAALNDGRLDADDDRLAAHLQHCLGCRACEHYCPSGVPFGAIMDEARALLKSPHHGPRRLPYLPRKLLARLSQRRLFPWLRRYQRWGMQHLARSTGLLRLLGLSQTDNLLPAIPAAHHWHDYYPPQAAKRGDVALFTGCITETLGQGGLASSIRLLNTLGYGVFVPPAQGCCGALHQHNGDSPQAVRLARQNLGAFASLEIDAILHTATGCTAMLSEYHRLPGLPAELRETARQFTAKVADINQFLLQCEWPPHLRCQPLAHRIAVHTPCSQVHVLRQAETTLQLLQRIPLVELVPLADNERCCGGAGSYLLTQPEWATRLRQPKIDNLIQLHPHTLVTSNMGCALHLGAGLREQGITLEILHPVELLVRQLEGENH